MTPEAFKPQVRVTITVAFDAADGSVHFHTRAKTWGSKNGLTADQVPDHIDEMVLRTLDQLKPAYRHHRIEGEAVTILPTGEKLPDYDDGPADGVDTDAMHRWLTGRLPDYWTSANIREKQLIRDVLAALQAVADATLVKNDTYRTMRRDGVDIERLAAHLSNTGHADLVVDRGGNPVTAVIALLTPLD